MHLASSRRPAMAIQLYSAIHYTAIQRYTVYMLYIIPLPCRALVRFPIEIRNMGALKGQFLNRAHAEPALAAREINLLPGGARGKY